MRGGGVTPTLTGTGTTSYNYPAEFDFEAERVCCDVYVQEKHLTVIRKGPTMRPTLEMYSWEDPDSTTTDIHEDAVLETIFSGADMLPNPAHDGKI